MILALTGATGFLGQEIARQANARGIPVRALIRQGAAPPGAEPVAGDLGDRAALDRLMDGADAVVHCAALMGSSDGAALWRVNVDGTRAVIAAALAAGVGRLVHVSSVAALRPQHGAYSASKAAAEAAVRASGLASVIVRPPVLIGAGSQLQRTLDALGRMPFVPVIAGGAPLAPVRVEAAAQACLEAALDPEAAGLWTLAGPERVDFVELSRRTLRSSGSGAALVPLPGGLALTLAAVAERLLPAPPLTVEGVRAVLAGSPEASRS